jgi:O-antigen/teichoic acid export membrane protein
MSIKQKAIQGVIWSAIQNWGSQAGSLVVFFVLARLLSPDTFGLVALANVFVVFMQIFLHQGFAQALIQRQQLDPEHLDTAFWTNVGIGCLLAIVGLTGAEHIAGWFNQPQLTPILRVLSLVFIVNSLNDVQQAVLERQFAFKSVAIRSLLAVVISGGVGIGMAIAGFGVWSLVGQQLIYETVAVAVLWGASDWRPGWRFSVAHFQDLFSFGVNILGSNFLNYINTRADDFLIGYFLGPTALGYYAIAYRVLTVMTQLLVSTIAQVALPTFSRLQEDLEKFRRAFYTATQLTSFVAFPTFLGMAVMARELVLVLFGEQWLPSVPVMQVLALAGILRSVTFAKGSVFMALGKPGWQFRLSLLNAVLNITGFLIAVRWGILAVAASYVIRAYSVFPLGQWLLSKLTQIRLSVYLRQFIAPLLASGVMVAIMLAVKYWFTPILNPLLLLMTCSVIGAIVYSAAIRVTSPRLFQQVLDIVRLARSRSKQPQV